MTTASLTLATYNIHSGVGGDGAYRPDRIAAVIDQLDAQVIGLQEVDAGYRDFPEGVDLARYLADHTSHQLVRGPTLERHTGVYGNVLLTSLDVVAVRRRDLSFRRREPRGLLDVELRRAGRRIRVLVTHFGVRPRERRHQVEGLFEQIARSPTRPCFLLGDINEWFRGARLLRRLDREFGASRALRTFPAWLPLFPLDRIWARPTSVVSDVRVLRSRLARRASDHLPVLARCVLDGEQDLANPRSSSVREPAGQRRAGREPAPTLLR